MARSTAQCIARVAAKGSISQKEAEQILEDVSARAERMRATGSPDAVVQAAGEAAMAIKEKARSDLARAIRNADKRAALISDATRDGVGPQAADRLRGKLTWQPGDDPKGNVQTLGRSLTHGWASAIYAELQKAGALKVAGSPQMFREIARAIWDIKASDNRNWPLFIAQASGDKAKQVAAIIHAGQEAMRLRLNSEGAAIADAKDWAGSTQHDPFLLTRGGRNQPVLKDYDAAQRRWWNFVAPRLAEKTFDDLRQDIGSNFAEVSPTEARDEFGKRVFNALYTGVHIKEGSGDGWAKSFGPGGGNIAKKISEGRVLFWKDADAWSDYMTQYGRSTTWYSMIEQSAEQAGRKAALMHFFGDSPANNLALVERRIAEQNRDTNPEGVVNFKNNAAGNNPAKPALAQIMAQLDGSANVPQSSMWHRLGSTVRAFYDMVYLGSVGFTHAASLLATFPSEARMHGQNTFQALGGLARALAPHGADNADVLAELGAYGEGMARYTVDPFAQGQNFPGYVAAMHNRFMNATGLPYLFEHSKAGMREMLANALGRKIGGEFTDLHPALQRALTGYGIGPEEWGLLKTGEVTKSGSGAPYLTPHAGLTADQGAVEQSLLRAGTITDTAERETVGQAIADKQRSMADSLMMYYQDAADRATVTSGARERAFLRGTMKPGSLQDELMSSLLQFKSWPVAAMHQVIGREFYDNATKGQAALGIGLVVGLSMLGGYLRMTARDLTSGENPRVPRTIGEAGKLAVAALAQGGGLGIFGDFLFGEANRFGASNLSSFGGPVATDATMLYSIYNRWLQSIGTDKASDVWPELARFGIQHIPGANLFYLKGAADYMAFFHMFEAMKPGWWERTNRRMQRQEGRTMQGYVPGAGVPYGVPPVLVH